MKKLLLLLFFTSLNAYATDPIIISDAVGINKVLSKIPETDKEMNYNNIGERLTNIGMSVSSVIVYKVLKKIDLESKTDRIGDVFYRITTSNPSEVLNKYYCDMMRSPTYLKRGGRYIPQDRTAVWLMTSKCELPEDPK